MASSLRFAWRACAFALAIASPLAVHAQSTAPPALDEAIALYNAGDSSAGRMFEAVAAVDPDEPWAQFYLGKIALDDGDHDTAIEYLESAVGTEPAVATFHHALGEAYLARLQNSSVFRQLGISRQVRAAYQKALELDPADIDARMSWVGYLANAPGIAGGDVDEAERQAGMIAARDSFEGHLAMAMVHEARDRDDLARNELRAAIAQRPEDTGLRMRLVLQLQSVRRFEEAWRYLDEGLQYEPDNVRVLYQRGRTAAMSGKHLEDGEASLERFIELADDVAELPLPWAWHRLGQVRVHRGDTGGARVAFEEALRLDPDLDDARDALKKLR